MSTEVEFDPVVYRAWPVEVIREAWEQFRDIMYDGAGIEELEAGLHGMDFLMRASDVPEPLLTMIEATLDGARTRIALMAQAELERLSEKEQMEKIIGGVRTLSLQISAIKRRYVDAPLDPEYVQEWVRKRVQARMAEGAAR